jgi:hypothetical protein
MRKYAARLSSLGDTAVTRLALNQQARAQAAKRGRSGCTSGACDELIVLALALKSLQVTGPTTRYARWSNLVGGAVLIGVGTLLIFKSLSLTFA